MTSTDLKIRLDQYHAGTTSALNLTEQEAAELISDLDELQRRREAMRCAKCDGTGTITYPGQGVPFTAACSKCHGTGDMLPPQPGTGAVKGER